MPSPGGGQEGRVPMDAESIVFPPEYYEFERDGQYLFFDPQSFVWFVTDPLGRLAVRGLAEGGQEGARSAVAEATSNRAEDAAPYVRRWLNRLLELGFLHESEYVRRMPERILSEHPSDLYLHVTSRCNLRCLYCYNLDHRDGMRQVAAGRLEEFLAVIDEAAEIGFESLRITGGEALLNPGVVTMARRGKEHGLMVNLLTNGTLVTPERAREIAECVDVVSISLDSADPEEHDRMRGRGSHAKVLRSLALLKEAGLRYLHLNAVVTPLNLGSVREYLELAWNRLGADQVTLAPSEAELVDPRGIRNGVVYVLGPDDLLRLQEIEQEFYRERGHVPESNASALWRCQCGAGNGVVSVDANGDVYPCQTLHSEEFLCGNAFTEGLATALAGSRPLRWMKELTVDRLDGCSRCAMRYLCGGGCRFHAHAREGRADVRDRHLCKVSFRRSLDSLWSAARHPVGAGPAAAGDPEVRPFAPPC